MNKLKLIHIEIDKNSHTIQYFKSNKEKLWFYLNDICKIMDTYYKLSYSDIAKFCKDFGKTNVCTSHSMYKTSEGEEIYIKELEYPGVFIDFSTIDKLSKKYSDLRAYSDVVTYSKLDKLKDAIRDNFEELRIEITEDEVERRVEAVKKEIDDLLDLKKSIEEQRKHFRKKKKIF